MTPAARRWVETLAAMLLGAAACALVLLPQLRAFDGRVGDLEGVVDVQGARLRHIGEACQIVRPTVPVTCTFTLHAPAVGMP